MKQTQKLLESELDQNLLKGGFKELTSWCVITGAPCSGKTTVIEELTKKGYECFPETARGFIEEQLADGRTLEEIRSDEGQFQRGLLDSKLRLEEQRSNNSLTFLDRAMPDSITYFRVAGLDPNEVLPHCLRYKYAMVFLFERLPLEIDNARTEDEETAAFIDEWIEKDYRSLGYEVIPVPVMSVSDRTEFVLKQARKARLLK